MQQKNTREHLLDLAFEEFYVHGFQGANTSIILKKAGINKGSMYHFFASKKELGLAVIRERIARRIEKRYAPIADQPEIIKSLITLFRNAYEELKEGCPLNNMVQEMATLDEDYRKALVEVYDFFESHVANLLKKAHQNGEIKSCDFEKTATYIIAVYEGAQLVSKTDPDPVRFNSIIDMLERQLLS